MNLITVYDVIHANIGHLPAGQLAAGYTTGHGVVPWSASDWSKHPGAVRIDQDPAASDYTADVLDVERGAATIADVVPWVRAAWSSISTGRRVGQRLPTIYASASNITPIANQLQAAGIMSRVYLWVADWNIGELAADTDVLGASGPWPVIGVQWKSTPYYDIDVFSAAWLGNVVPSPRPGNAPTWPAGTTLQFGNVGDAVEALQRAFRDSGIRGVRGIEVDGVFGQQTQTATRNFEGAEHLDLDAGIAGPQVRNALIALGRLTLGGEAVS